MELRFRGLGIECQGMSIFTSMCVFAAHKADSCRPKDSCRCKLFIFTQDFQFPPPFPPFPLRFCTISQHQEKTTFTSSKQKFLFEKSAAEVDFCSARFVAKAAVPPAPPAPPTAAAGSYCLLQIILTVLARDSRSNKGSTRRRGYAVLLCCLQCVRTVCCMLCMLTRSAVGYIMHALYRFLCNYVLYIPYAVCVVYMFNLCMISPCMLYAVLCLLSSFRLLCVSAVSCLLYVV